MIAAFLLAAALTSAPAGPQSLNVEVVEYNRVIDDCGKLVYEQIMFRRWTPSRSGPSHYVSQYFVVDGEPERDRRGDRYEFLFHGIRVSARSYRRTVSNFDPEWKEKQKLSPAYRRPYRVSN